MPRMSAELLACLAGLYSGMCSALRPLSFSLSAAGTASYALYMFENMVVPSTGGNTMFSNMYKAYEAVPAALREKLRGRKALHIPEYNPARQANSSADMRGIPHHFHPVFITHPETGRKTLFVDRLMTTRIEGLGAEESSAILDQLYDIGERREFIFEHVWRLGDFVMWDNRCTTHARTDFPKDEPRLLRRCTVEGEPLYESADFASARAT